MSEKRWEDHLMAALELVRDLRYNAVMQNLDPKAVRTALKYAVLVDTYLSKECGLTEEEDCKITEIAQELFKKHLKAF